MKIPNILFIAPLLTSAYLMTACRDTYVSSICSFDRAETFLKVDSQFFLHQNNQTSPSPLDVQLESQTKEYQVSVNNPQPGESALPIKFCHYMSSLYGEVRTPKGNFALMNAQINQWEELSEHSKHRSIILRTVFFDENKLAAAGVGFVKTIDNGQTTIKILNSNFPYYYLYEGIDKNLIGNEYQIEEIRPKSSIPYSSFKENIDNSLKDFSHKSLLGFVLTITKDFDEYTFTLEGSLGTKCRGSAREANETAEGLLVKLDLEYCQSKLKGPLVNMSQATVLLRSIDKFAEFKGYKSTEDELIKKHYLDVNMHSDL